MERGNKEAKKHVSATIIRRSKQQKQLDIIPTANQKRGEGKEYGGTSKGNQDSKHEVGNWPQTLIYPEGKYNIQFHQITSLDEMFIPTNFPPGL